MVHTCFLNLEKYNHIQFQYCEFLIYFAVAQLGGAYFKLAPQSNF